MKYDDEKKVARLSEAWEALSEADKRRVQLCGVGSLAKAVRETAQQGGWRGVWRWAISGIGATLLAGATAWLMNSCSTVYNREGADKVYAEVKLDPVSAIGSMFLKN